MYFILFVCITEFMHTFFYYIFGGFNRIYLESAGRKNQ